MWVRTGIGDVVQQARRGLQRRATTTRSSLTEVPFAELVQKYATAIAGGQAPDALSLDLIYNPAFAAAGQLEDLTDWAQGLPYFNDLSPSHVKLGTYRGPHLRPAALGRDLGLRLEQGPLRGGRPRPGKGAGHLGGDRRQRREDPRAR